MEKSIWNIRIKHGFDSCFVPAERRVKYEQDKPIDSCGESFLPVFGKSKAWSMSTTQQRMQ
jgi:hypothetical protein